jgi:hypothetical protein
VTFLSFQSFGQGLGLVKADKLKDWRIDEYTIIYSKKLGPAGPHYYEYDVYKGTKYLSYAAYIIDKDSCQLLFREKNDYYITFNLCSSTKLILTEDKTKLNIGEIDSISIRPYDSVRFRPRDTYLAPFYDTIVTKNFDSAITKKLNENQVKIFVKRWNSAKVNGFDRLGKGYHYLITVYTNNTVRRFRALNFYITENGLWSYKTKEDIFFEKLWLDKE